MQSIINDLSMVSVSIHVIGEFGEGGQHKENWSGLSESITEQVHTPCKSIWKNGCKEVKYPTQIELRNK